jgi:2-keto-4-pentenoate hydratase
VGWKVGAGDRERIGDGIVVGHLTSASVLDPGATYRADSAAALHADAEVALLIGRDGAIDGYATALELVDGVRVARAAVGRDHIEKAHSVADLLDAVGELRAGDRLITGSVVQVPVEPGSRVVADFGELGRVAIDVSR